MLSGSQIAELGLGGAAFGRPAEPIGGLQLKPLTMDSLTGASAMAFRSLDPHELHSLGTCSALAVIPLSFELHKIATIPGTLTTTTTTGILLTHQVDLGHTRHFLDSNLP